MEKIYVVFVEDAKKVVPVRAFKERVKAVKAMADFAAEDAENNIEWSKYFVEEWPLY